MLKIAITLGCACLLAGTAAAQSPAHTERIVDESRMRAEAENARSRELLQTRVQESRMRIPLEARVVTGAPYSADVVSESVQVLSDGNRIVHRDISHVARDEQGRVRREEERNGQVMAISINDPVAGVSYMLDPVAKTALKMPYANVMQLKRPALTDADPSEVELRRQVEQEIARKREQELAHARTQGEVARVREPEPDPARRREQEVEVQRKREMEQAHRSVRVLQLDKQPAGTMVMLPRSAEGGAKWEEQVEKLAPREIEGVMAEGIRTTRTIPAGAIGNERPIQIVSEEWRSPELQVLLLTTTSDPRNGESTYKLTNVHRGRPAASLFEVSSDYTVKDAALRMPVAIDRERRE